LHLGACCDTPRDLLPFGVFLRHQQRYALFQHLAFGVPKHLCGARVPAEQQAVHRPAHDGIIGGADEGGEQAQLVFLRLLLSDVATDAAIAFEAPGRIEDRLAAHGEVVFSTVGIAHAVLEVLEWLALRQGLRVRGPLLIRLPLNRQFEAGASQNRAPDDVPIGTPFSRVIGEAQFLVLLPAPVVGQRGERAQPLMALRKLALGFLLRADVADDARYTDDRAAGVAQRRETDRDVDALAAARDPHCLAAVNRFAC